MKRIIAFAWILLISFMSWTQNIDLRTELTAELTVCQESEVSLIVATNNTGVAIEDVVIEVVLPPGVVYEPSSLVVMAANGVVEGDVTDSESLKFNAVNIPAGDSIAFQISYIANMDALTHQNGGGLFRNEVRLLHSDGFEFHTSESYNILYPSLTIMDVLPTYQTVLSGNTTTRTFKLVNAGYGKTDVIYIKDVFTTGAELTGVSIGTIVGDSIVLTGADFEAFGNNDGFFDSNESLVIEETIAVYSCSDITASSVIQAVWGCGGQLDYSGNSYAHVSVDFQSPSIELIAEDSLYIGFGSGLPSKQQLKLVNKGTGVANDLVLDVFKSSGAGYDESIYSRFDAGSFTYKIGASGSVSSVTPVQAFSTASDGDYSCLGDGAIGKVVLELPNLSPEDTLYLEWDMYSCCIDVCENNKVKGWDADLVYSDVCDLVTYEEAVEGQENNSQLMTVFTETPTDLYSGISEEFVFRISSFENTLPQNENSFYRFELELEDGLNYEGLNFNSNGVVWEPSDISYDALENRVVALFQLPEPFVLPKSELEVIVSGNCGETGWKYINLDIAYIPDNTLASICEVPLVCAEVVTTYLHCPLLDCNGLRFTDFKVERINFGMPDNNLDGVGDVSGELNFNEVKKNRAMVGDSICATAIGAVHSDAGDTWSFGKLISKNNYGTNLNFVKGELLLYNQVSNTYYPVALVSPTVSDVGTVRTFEFDLGLSELALTNSELSGLNYANGDSLQVKIWYEVVSSVAGLIQETLWENEFYIANSNSPTAEEKMQCDEQFDRTTLIGYSWRNDFGNNFTIRSCSKKVSQNFGMSIGDCCSNYGGGNLFPFEYRNWGNIKSARVVIPSNYQVVNTTLRQRSTRNTNSVNTQTLSAIEPDQIIGDTLIYDLEQYVLSGLLKYSDDGFHGDLAIELAPNCEVAQNVYEPISWEFNYTLNTILGGGESGNVSGPNDNVRYVPSNLAISAVNPWVDVNTKEVQWEIKVNNNANSTADNAWLHIAHPTNLSITEVIDNTTGAALDMASDLFLIGQINSKQTKKYTIKGLVSNCDTLLFNIYTGFECVGYPADFASFTCNISETTLYVEPKPSAYQVRLFSDPIVGDACSPYVSLGLDIASVKSAHMYDMEIKLTAPNTEKINVVADSGYFKYNMDQDYEMISEPQFIDPTYVYDINNYDANFETDGIPGAYDLENNRYKWKTSLFLGDEFVAGDYVQIQIDGKNACDVDLPTVYLNFDPNIKFLKDNTAGLNIFSGNTWSSSWGDYDGDGFEDLYVPNKDVAQPNALYHNNGDGTLTRVYLNEITSDLGESVTSSWADYDNDNDLDLFVANNTYAPNRLYNNQGDGTFISVQDDPIVQDGVYSHSACWGDYDNDGFVDLAVSDIHPTNFNFLFHNNGDGTFETVTESVISQTASSGVGASWADYDNDGDLDLFIANTNGENNSLFRNDGGVFALVEDSPVVTDGGHSIGGIWGDYDNDMDLDLYVTNSPAHEANFFYENNGDGTFTKIISGVILSGTSNSHGASWIDYDNDGDIDLLVANDQNNKNFLYSNNGDKTFNKITNAITEEQTDSYGTAWADYDNDGDYDLHISNHGDATNDFFINEKGACSNYFGLLLNGCNSNFVGIGTQIKLKATIRGEEVWQMREVSSQTSALGGQNSLKTIFGLDDASIVDSLIVLWPSGMRQVLVNQSVNQIIVMNEDCGVKICGTLFFDENENDVFDAEESGIPNKEIVIQPGNIKAYSNADGYYQVYVNEGTYTVTSGEDDKWGQRFPEAGLGYEIVVDPTDVEGNCDNAFGYLPSCNEPDLALQIGATAFRRGLTNDVTITITNEGAYVTSGVTELKLTMSSDCYLVGGGWLSVTESLESREYVYQFNTIEGLSDTTFNVIDSIAVSANLDDVVNFSGAVDYVGTECGTANNTVEIFDVVVGSIDPNDKQALILNKGNVASVSPSDTIIYKIRFQNVGNYAARRVLISDTLSPLLDWTTFKPLESSHEFSMSISNGVITWVNNGIELPDSTSDPEGSNGAISFSIQTRKDCKAYEIVKNKAAIQFDYNPFIITNTTELRVDLSEEVIVNGVFLFPNPAKDKVVIKLLDQGEVPQVFKSIELYNPFGKVVMSVDMQGDESVLDVSKLVGGAYLVKVMDQNNEGHYGKLIVK